MWILKAQAYTKLYISNRKDSNGEPDSHKGLCHETEKIAR
jgi:hypothetical protein